MSLSPHGGAAKHSCYFLELRQGEVRHSRGPDGPGPPARRCPYRRALLVVSAHTKDRDGGGLRGSARGKAKGRSPVAWELRPMREAGVPSTGGWVVPAPPGVVMLAPPEVPRNAERAQSEGRIVEDGQPPVATAFPASPLLF